MTQTILTIKEQNEYLAKNFTKKALTHKWSSRGMGNSKILDRYGDIFGKAGGCGYDRFGAALGEAITTLFSRELYKLAKRECKGKRGAIRKTSSKFYGLYYSQKKDAAYVDGACGEDSMKKILNKIGFSLEYVGESERSNNGEVFYNLVPVTKTNRRWL